MHDMIGMRAFTAVGGVAASLRAGVAASCLVGVAASFLLVGPALSQQLSLPDSLAHRIDALFADFAKASSPGCAVGVVDAGGLAYAEGYGMADLQHDVPITPSTVFHVASTSKQFTAFAVALLATEGKLSLDDDVRTYLPELHDFGHRITLLNLLTHTSGLRDQWTLLALAGWRPYDVKTQDDILRLAFRQKELNFVPGDEWLYSNTGYTLLAEIVERVWGQSLGAFTRARVFEPLGMHDTHFSNDHNEIVKRRAAAYETTESGWRISVPVFDNYGATSLLTTVEDLSLWAQNYWTRAFEPEAMEMLLETRITLNDGSELTRYGLGLGFGRPGDLEAIGHGGVDAGFRSDLLVFPSHRVAAIALCNADAAVAFDLTPQMARVVLSDAWTDPAPDPDDSADADEAEPPAPPRLSPEALAAYAGRYYSAELDATYTFFVVDGSLLLRNPRLEVDTLRVEAPDTLLWKSRTLHFTRNADAVDGLTVSTGRVRNLRFRRLRDLD